MQTKGRRIMVTAGLVAFVVLALAVYLGWPHLVFWYRFESLGLNGRSFLEYRHRQTGIVMVRVPGGTFWMGAQKDDPNGPNYDPEAMPEEGPVHEVTLSPFLIARYEVTQAEWERVMGKNPSFFTGAHLPVDSVSWEDCRGFCRRAGLTLPTEAQWEYACGAGTLGPHVGTGRLEGMGWFESNSGGISHTVGEKAPNGFGLHDMHGNVMEFCQDASDSGFYSTPEAAGLDPVCTSGSESKALRGADCQRPPWRCTMRGGTHKDSHSPLIGFRVAASPPP